MNRTKIIQAKEKALDQMLLCMSIFHGNHDRPVHLSHEMVAHAALVSALIDELGPPYPGVFSARLDRETIERCVDRLGEYLANEASPTRLVADCLTDLRKLLREGGVS